MRGVNSTSRLKFDHPGLATTAARTADRLTIQNERRLCFGHANESCRCQTAS
jgi:hypothetical protein